MHGNRIYWGNRMLEGGRQYAEGLGAIPYAGEGINMLRDGGKKYANGNRYCCRYCSCPCYCYSYCCYYHCCNYYILPLPLPLPLLLLGVF